MTNVQYKDEFLDCVKQDLNNNYSEDERNLKLDLDFFEEQEIKNVFSSLFSASSVPNIFYIFGAGGVTSWFLPQLIKSLYAYNTKLQKNGCSFPIDFTIFLIDGDKVETKNLLRQNFILSDVGQNKALVLSERYSHIYPNIEIKAIDKYFYHKPFIEKYLPDTLKNYDNNFVDIHSLLDFNCYAACYFNLLDNELSKHMLDYCLIKKHSLVTLTNRYFSTGCDVYNGNVFSSLVGADYYSNYFRNNTFKVEDATIHQHSCAEIQEDMSIEQTMDSNTMAANLLAIAFNNYLADPVGFNTKKIDFISTKEPKVSTKTCNESLVFQLKLINDSSTGRQIKTYAKYSATSNFTGIEKRVYNVLKNVGYIQ